MRNRIEHPKVFISYAWGSEDYKIKVLSFATDLMNDGIEVILDQWSLKEEMIHMHSWSKVQQIQR